MSVLVQNLNQFDSIEKNISYIHIRNLSKQDEQVLLNSLICGDRSFPESLTSLCITGCHVLPKQARLPKNLKALKIKYSGITELPSLPSSLQVLKIIMCPELTQLSDLPNSISDIVVDHHLIKCVEECVPDELKYLYSHSEILEQNHMYHDGEIKAMKTKRTLCRVSNDLVRNEENINRRKNHILTITEFSDYELVNDYITHLTIELNENRSGNNIVPTLPINLKYLVIMGGGADRLGIVPRLPDSIETLCICECVDKYVIPNIPKNLKNLSSDKPIEIN